MSTTSIDEEYLSTEQIESNYHSVLDRIKLAAKKSGRPLLDIKLVVVSKEKPISTIENAINAGINIFGENYADQAIPKIIASHHHPDIQWHMIGHIQSRKAQMVIDYFNYIHSLDSVKLARRLDKFAGDRHKIMPALIEFNLSGEASKYGFAAWNEEMWGGLLPTIGQILDLPNIQIQGIMTVPPYAIDPEQSRTYFKSLVRLQGFLKRSFPQACWSELSMGMSADYEIAIEEGATWIRIGQAILGPRN